RPRPGDRAPRHPLLRQLRHHSDQRFPASHHGSFCPQRALSDDRAALGCGRHSAARFFPASWQETIVQRARREGFQRLYYNIDYFAFRRGLYAQIPDLVIGRNWWDQWLVWQAGAAGVPVIDVSEVVCAVHQNHDYSYHPQGMAGVWSDDATQENFRLAGGWSRLHTIEDATFRLTSAGMQPNR